MPAAQTKKPVEQRISPKEAQAKFLKAGFNVSEKTIREWCIQGDDLDAKKMHGRWYILPSSVDRMCQ